MINHTKMKKKNPLTEIPSTNDISQAAIPQNVKSLCIWSTCFFENVKSFFLNAHIPLQMIVFVNNPAAAANIIMVSFTSVNVNVLHASAQSSARLNKVTLMWR